MPVAHVNLLRGHSREKLREVIRQISMTMSRILESPAERLEVWVTEVDPELWGICGEPASEALRSQPHAAIEMPFVQMALMQNRPLAQHQALIAEVTDILVRVLGSDRERVRVHIADVDPEKWGIGGIPASVRRAAEIEARRASSAGASSNRQEGNRHDHAWNPAVGRGVHPGDGHVGSTSALRDPTGPARGTGG